MRKFKLFFILFFLGFLFISLDININTGFDYPNQYKNTDTVIGEFQYYNVSSNYGARCTYKYIDNSSTSENNVELETMPERTNSSVSSSAKVIDKVYFDGIRVDVFNDLIGFIFIMIACLGLIKTNSKFNLAFISSLCGIILCILLKGLPFFTNGLLLCNLAMAIGTAYLFCQILTTFLFTRGLFAMCPDVCCRDERKWGKIIWFITMVTQILTTFVFWVGSDFSSLLHLGYIIEASLILAVIALFIVMKKVYYYLQQSYMDSLEVKK